MTNPFYHGITFSGTRARNTITNQGKRHPTYAEAHAEATNHIPPYPTSDHFVAVFLVIDGVGGEVDATGKSIRTSIAGGRILSDLDPPTPTPTPTQGNQ